MHRPNILKSEKFFLHKNMIYFKEVFSDFHKKLKSPDDLVFHY